MANKAVELVASDGSLITESYVDNSDGTWARAVSTTGSTTPTGSDKLVNEVASDGSVIVTRYVSQGDGTWARLVTS